MKSLICSIDLTLLSLDKKECLSESVSPKIANKKMTKSRQIMLERRMTQMTPTPKLNFSVKEKIENEPTRPPSNSFNLRESPFKTQDKQNSDSTKSKSGKISFCFEMPM